MLRLSMTLSGEIHGDGEDPGTISTAEDGVLRGDGEDIILTVLLVRTILIMVQEQVATVTSIITAINIREAE